MRSRKRLISCLAGILNLLAPIIIGLGEWAGSAAAAELPRCRLELATRTDSGLRLLATEVNLHGQLLRAARFELELGREQTAAPTTRRPLLPAEKKLRFVLLLESSAAYAPATDSVRAAVQGFLRALPPESTGEMWRFGNQVDVPLGLQSISHLTALVDRYSATDEGEIQLIKAVRQGLTVLGNEAEPGARRVLVLLSDGFNPVMDRKLFREVGQELAQRGVPLFPVAFSPRDIRGPLRNLGELARHSAGTLRWARSLTELQPQFAALADELLAAEVLTFDGPAVAKQSGDKTSLRLKCGEEHSNPCLVMGPPRRGRAIWLGMGVFIAAAAAAALLIRRLQQAAKRATAVRSGPRLTGCSGGLRGQQVFLQDVLTVGIGLSGPGTWSLAPGPADPRCEIRHDGNFRYLISSHGRNSRVFINGSLLLGSVGLQHGDQVQIEDLCEFMFSIK